MRSLAGLLLAAAGVAALSCNEAVLDVPVGMEGADAGSASVAPDGGGSLRTDGGTSSGARDAGGGSDGGVAAPEDGGREEGGTTPPGSAAATVIVEPSDSGQAFLAAVRAAKTSIHMTMYLLTDTTLMKELTDQAAAKLDVKVVLNQTFPQQGSDSGSNASSYSALTNGGVSTVWAPSAFTYTHEKAVLIDGTQLWILTMNATYSGRTSNREYLVSDTDATDIAEAEAIFQADYADQTFTPSGKLLVSPVNMRSGLDAIIGSARATLDFEVEEVLDGGIVSDLCAATARGVAVRGVVADLGDSAETPVFASLKSCGVSLVQLETPYVHAKAIVVDGASAYVGSANFSSTSLDHNRELGTILDDTSAVTSVASTIAADFAAGAAL